MILLQQCRITNTVYNKYNKSSNREAGVYKTETTSTFCAAAANAIQSSSADGEESASANGCASVSGYEGK